MLHARFSACHIEKLGMGLGTRLLSLSVVHFLTRAFSLFRARLDPVGVQVSSLQACLLTSLGASPLLERP